MADSSASESQQSKEIEVEEVVVEDIDDEDVALAKGLDDSAEQSGILMGYMPVYIGIGAAAVAVLAVAAVYLKKRRRPAANRTDADHRRRR